MSKRIKTKGLHQSGRYWLDWDNRRDGTLRSPYLTIFWYDEAVKRVRSTSTGTTDIENARVQLLRKDLIESGMSNACPTCGQRLDPTVNFLLTDAISDYLLLKDDYQAAVRLEPVLDYIEHTNGSNLRCQDASEVWIENFRQWLMAKPVVYSSGRIRVEPRALSTVENSVIALAAAINLAHKNHKASEGAPFRPIQTKYLNNTPQVRLSVQQIATAFEYATDPAYPVKRLALHRYLIAAVSTLARPDAIYDISTAPSRNQWNGAMRVLNLNQKGRRQTKKYRPTIPASWQFALHLDGADGFFVPVKDIRSAWDTMCDALGWPKDGQYGPKLIRRSMAKLLRDRLPKSDWKEVELFLGHDKFDSVSDIYAPFDPDYLAAARAEIERITDEICRFVPNSFHRTNTGDMRVVAPIRGRDFA